MDAWFKIGLVLTLGLAVIVGVAVAKSQPQATVAAPPPTPTVVPPLLPNRVDIVDSPGEPPARFDPPVFQVRVGTTVTWTNDSASDQSVTADNGAFSSDVLSQGQSFTWRPVKPGRYT